MDGTGQQWPVSIVTRMRIFLARMVLVTSFLLANAFPQEAVAPWSSDLAQGKRALAAGKYAEAVDSFKNALSKAEENQAPATQILPLLQSLASGQRIGGNWMEAEATLTRILAIVQELQGSSSAKTASVFSDLAAVQQAQSRRKEAYQSITKAIEIRSAIGLSEELAKDFTLAGAIQLEAGEAATAKNMFQQGLALWGALPSSGLQILTALDPLAGIYRDESDYTNAEELYKWALRLREAALGPQHSELIATLDSLAYVYFGQKKYAEAEITYQRVLALWETSAGPDHPMVALTLDKMVEFYTAQKLYDKAEPLSQRSLAMRTKTEIESFHRMGRVLVGQQNFEAALDLYARLNRIAADAKVPDEQLDGVLRSYAMLLRQAKKESEAVAVDRRIRDALIRRADRDGRRPVPTPKPQ